jgi:DsbC/DsbD-like thiol-disulfide interchange protein
VKIPSLLVVVLCAGALLGARAQAQVEASLVSAETSIQPGHPFSVALRLHHAPHWHTYWINPGIGYPTSLTWRLPAGFTAGEIQWPTPQVLKSDTGEITGNGYEGDTLLLVRVTPPRSLKPGTAISLATTAKWLMCERECIPGQSELTLALPVWAAPPNPDAQWADRLARTLAELPKALPDWSATATRNGNVVTLTMKPTHALTQTHPNLHFFAVDNYIGYELPQEIKSTSDGGFAMTLHVSAEGPEKPPSRLQGVLSTDEGWGPGGSVRGLRIDVPL